MSAIQILEKQVKKLKPNALAAFRDWFRKYDSDAWDRQIKKDARTGKLESFAREKRVPSSTDMVRLMQSQYLLNIRK